MRIYDFFFKTGSDFGNSYSPKDDTNIEANFNQSLNISSEYVSGNNYTRLSCNGQTLAEQNAIFSGVGFDGYYVNSNSGDYYFRTGENYRKVEFADNFETTNAQSDIYFYNIKDDFREIPLRGGVGSAARTALFRGQIITKFPDRTGTITGMTSFDYFLNGQKIYTGIDGSYMISGADSQFYDLDRYRGKLFAIPKNNGIKNVTGNLADIYGESFVESTVFGYLNGVSLHKKNWLELSTGVTLISTGVQPLFFQNIIKTQNITL